MANSIKLETCPQCGATLAANQVKLLKTDPLEYVCPKQVEKRKDWENNWGDDIDDEMNDRLTAQFEKNLNRAQERVRLMDESIKSHAEAS